MIIIIIITITIRTPQRCSPRKLFGYSLQGGAVGGGCHILIVIVIVIVIVQFAIGYSLQGGAVGGGCSGWG